MEIETLWYYLKQKALSSACTQSYLILTLHLSESDGNSVITLRGMLSLAKVWDKWKFALFVSRDKKSGYRRSH